MMNIGSLDLSRILADIPMSIDASYDFCTGN